jgi:WD40 repeat protein
MVSFILIRQIRSLVMLFRSWLIPSLTFFLGIGFLLSFPGNRATGVQHSKADSSLPLWQVDLHTLGYDGYVPPKEFQNRPLLYPVTFTSDNKLVISFLTRSSETSLHVRQQPNELLALQLHAVFLDAKSGGTVRKQVWPTSHPQVDVVAGRDGSLVVVLPDRVSTYSPTMDLVNELKLVNGDKPPGTIRAVDKSPQGGSLMLKFMGQAVKFLWLETKTLRVMASGQDIMTFSDISDHQLARSTETFVKSSGYYHEVRILNADGRTYTICKGRSSCGFPKFVNDDVLALLGSQDLKLVSVRDGAPIYSTNLQGEDYFYVGESGWRVSADGSRFAASIWNYRGGSTLLDITAHAILRKILVFDSTSRKVIYTLDLRTEKIKQLDGMAVSPDGSTLAVLVNGLVKLYQLPDRNQIDRQNGR